MYHSRVSNVSCDLANSESTSASEMQWNAKSHAAYHGYSHLSGMEIMSALLTCCHSWLRPCLRSLGVGRSFPSRRTLVPACRHKTACNLPVPRVSLKPRRSWRETVAASLHQASTTRCCETTTAAIDELSLLPVHDCERSPASKCLPVRPSRIRRTRRSSD